VKLITQIKVEPEAPQELLLLMMRFNNVCNYLSEIAYQEKLFHWLPLQRRAYYEVRQRFGLRAAETLIAIRKVAYAYRNKARRNQQAIFHLRGSIPLFKHVYRDSKVQFYGFIASIMTRGDIALPKQPKQGTLSYKNGKFLIHQSIEVEAPPPYEAKDYLGCDLGVKNILVDSEGEIYSSGHLNGLRKRHSRLRAKLQSKGTRSARKLLNKRRYKESHFARDVNHQISKRVVEKALTATFGIALEDLKGIRERVRVRKADRRQHNSWGFNQLRLFIAYKAELKGVPLVLVDPKNTSRACPECGCIDKRNRKSQSDFLCIQCGFGQHADTVAARNIASRAAGNQPYAPSEEDVQVPELVVKG
jgi:IS605 OrfB family transposase